MRFPSWRKRPPITIDSLTDQLENYMATLADVNTALTGLRSDFDTLVTQATALYTTLKNTPPPAATAAELDAVVATVNADRDAVRAAAATLTATPA